MKKQSLKALAPMAIFAIAVSAMAEEPEAVVERTAEVSEILNAGAEKVQAAKNLKLKLIALQIRPMVCFKNSSKSTSKLNH